MPEQIVSSAASAVTGEVVRILFSGIVGRIYRKAVDDDKKLRRLKLLLIKIHSAVEASEKHAIENAWLLVWRDTLREAAAEGDAVLAGFRERRQRASHQQQEQGRPASCSTETRPFPTDEDMGRLNSAVERLEKLSPEIGMFVKLLKLETLTPEQTTTAENRGRKRERPDDNSIRHSGRAAHAHDLETPWSTKRARTSASSGNEPPFKLQALCCSLNAGEAGIEEEALVPAALATNMEEGSPVDETVDATSQEERERSTTLVDRLEEAFAAICKTVELADGRDLRGREWLARWASMLREAKARGCAVLGAISARRSATVDADAGSHRRCAGEATAVASTSLPDDWDDYELGRFVCGMESLAGEVDYFAGLACLCPSY